MLSAPPQSMYLMLSLSSAILIALSAAMPLVLGDDTLMDYAARTCDYISFIKIPFTSLSSIPRYLIVTDGLE